MAKAESIRISEVYYTVILSSPTLILGHVEQLNNSNVIIMESTGAAVSIMHLKQCIFPLQTCTLGTWCQKWISAIICYCVNFCLHFADPYLLFANRPSIQRIELNGTGLTMLYGDNDGSNRYEGLDLDIR